MTATDVGEEDPFEHVPPETVQRYRDFLNGRWVELERAQRMWFHLDYEKMPITPHTIALALFELAESIDDERAILLLSVVRALAGRDPHLLLNLQQNKRGRFRSVAAGYNEDRDHWQWLVELAALEHQGIKTESAVAELSKRFGVSRATFFSGIREVEFRLNVGRELGGPDYADTLSNPRPAKNGKG